MGSLRLGTHNVNGIRASLRRGFAEFWDSSDADVVGLQEVRCRVADLPERAFGRYHTTLEPGTAAGRNGVAVLTRTAPVRVRSLSGSAVAIPAGGSPVGIPAERIANRDLAPFAGEGRYVEVDLADAPVRVASIYLPKGATPEPPGWEPIGERPPRGWEHDQAKYDRKMRFLRGLSRLLVASRREAAGEGREFVIVGDFNIAHTARDLRNWRSNQRSEGFLPEEREWFGSVLGARRLVDVVRHLHGDVDGPYTWWSWLGQSFNKDTGWRIDYHLASPRLARAATSAHIAREDSYEARMSDHCPVVVDYDLTRLPPAPGAALTD